MKNKKKILIPIVSLATIGATIPCLTAIVGCANNNHISIKDIAKTQTIVNDAVSFPMNWNDGISLDRKIEAKVLVDDVNWAFTLEVKPFPIETNTIEMFLTLIAGVPNQTHSFDVMFSCIKINDGYTLWQQTINGFKIIYNQ